jgi:hypothetical protein
MTVAPLPRARAEPGAFKQGRLMEAIPLSGEAARLQPRRTLGKEHLWQARR